MKTVDLKKLVVELTEYPKEREWFEFKENWYEPHELGEYISALANTAALTGERFGYLVWGVKDDSHEIVGTRFSWIVDVKREPLEHYLARQLFPDNNFSFHDVDIDGKHVVILQVPAASKSPVSFDGVRYLRIGSSKANLAKFPEREAELFHVLRDGFPTISNTEAEYQELTFDKLFVYYGAKGITLNKRTFKKNLGLLTADGKYNLLAQLLSDDSHFAFRFAVFSGKTKTSTMYAVRELGNTCLLYSLDKALEYGEVLNVPQADERDRKVERKEVFLFDAAAFREAIINAFVHNSWITGNAPMITAFSDRIEILSRGTLPPGQTMEGFFAGESVPVNQRLSDVFLQLHISERTGRGVPKVTEVYGKESYEFREQSIVCTIPFDRLSDAPVNAPVNVPVNAPVESGNVSDNIGMADETVGIEEKILMFCVDPKGILEICSYLGYKDKRSVRKYLNPLLRQGRISMTIPDKPNSRLQKYVAIK